MENIHLIIVALNTAIKYYFSIPDWNSRSVVLLLLSLLVCDIERIIEGRAVQVYEEGRMTFTVFNNVQKDIVFANACQLNLTNKRKSNPSAWFI